MSWLTRPFDRPACPSPLPGRRPQIEPLEDRSVPTVLYYGGNLLPHVEAQPLFLGDRWPSGALAATIGTTNRFLPDLTGGAYMDALTRAGYGVGRGTATAGATDRVALPVNSIISDRFIRAEIQADIGKRILAAPDANRL